MSNIKERLDLVRTRIQTRDFLEGKGLSNEVNILMFCYDAEDELTVRHFVDQLATDQNLECNLKVCDLYETYLSLCEDLDILDAIPDMEESDGSIYLLEQLHSAIGNDAFIDKMQYDDHKLGDVLMLTGVGEVFPFMRVHKLLEAMQPYFSDIPIIVMYPGKFDGHSMQLFSRLKPTTTTEHLTLSNGGQKNDYQKYVCGRYQPPNKWSNQSRPIRRRYNRTGN